MSLKPFLLSACQVSSPVLPGSVPVQRTALNVNMVLFAAYSALIHADYR